MAGFIANYREDDDMGEITSGCHTDVTQNAEKDGVVCRICHKASIISSVLCPRVGGVVHMKHCPNCRYFVSLLWTCSYRKNKK